MREVHRGQTGEAIKNYHRSLVGNRPLNHWVAIIAMVAMIAAEVHAASFDCARARSVTEKLICATPALSAADEELAEIYRRAKERMERSGPESDPAQWFKSNAVAEWNWREKNCQDVPCLAAWYRQRKALLLWIATSEDVLGDYGLAVINLPGGEVLLSYGMASHTRNVIFDPERNHFRRFPNGTVVLNSDPNVPLTLTERKSYFEEGGAFWFNADVDLEGRIYRIWAEDAARCMSREEFVSRTSYSAEDISWLSQEQICVKI